MMDDVSIVENVESLPDSYVTYELLIRQQSLPDPSVRMRKRALIAILKQERDEGHKLPMVRHMPLDMDLADCGFLLNCVANDIRADLHANAVRCEIQLIFLRARWERLPMSPIRSLSSKRMELLEYIEVLVKCFAEVSVASGLDSRSCARFSTNVTVGPQGHLNTSSFGPFSFPHSASGSVHSSVSAHFTPPALPSGSGDVAAPDALSVHQSYVPDSSRLLLQSNVRPDAEIWKWQISFSGPDDPQTAISFLLKLNDIAMSHNVNPEDVLRGMPDILTGTAEKWFRTNIHKFTDYAVFSRLFLQNFEPSGNAIRAQDGTTTAVRDSCFFLSRPSNPQRAGSSVSIRGMFSRSLRRDSIYLIPIAQAFMTNASGVRLYNGLESRKACRESYPFDRGKTGGFNFFLHA